MFSEISEFVQSSYICLKKLQEAVFHLIQDSWLSLLLCSDGCRNICLYVHSAKNVTLSRFFGNWVHKLYKVNDF